MTPKSIAYRLRQLQRWSMSTGGGIQPTADGGVVKYADLEAILALLDEYDRANPSTPEGWDVCTCDVQDVQNEDGDWQCPECGTVKPF